MFSYYLRTYHFCMRQSAYALCKQKTEKPFKRWESLAEMPHSVAHCPHLPCCLCDETRPDPSRLKAPLLLANNDSLCDNEQLLPGCTALSFVAFVCKSYSLCMEPRPLTSLPTLSTIVCLGGSLPTSAPPGSLICCPQAALRASSSGLQGHLVPTPAVTMTTLL